MSALEISHARKERGFQAYALRLVGDIAAQHEPRNVEQAEAYYHQALALAEELGMRPLQAHCHRGLGTLYARSASGSRLGPRCQRLSTCTVLWR